MSRLLECQGCEAHYDVGEREPGKRVRCPRCRTVLVVPPRTPESERLVASSARLRRARGPSCKQHTTRVALSTCSLCRAPMCPDCVAPRPVDHACRACAASLGLQAAAPVDFGLLATYNLATQAFTASLPRLALWSLLALLVAFTVCAIPVVVGAMMASAAGGWEGALGQLGGCLILGGLLFFWIIREFVLVPAGCALFVDDVIRERSSGFGEAFLRTWRQVLRSAGPLFLIFLVYALLGTLLLLPGLVVFYYASQGLGWLHVDDQGHWQGSVIPLTLLLLELGLGTLLMTTALGLAVPVAVLEQRSAFEALGRSWELAQQRFWSLAGILLSFAVLYGVCGVAFQGLGRVTFPLVGLALSWLLDLFWPALLVSAYHGLAAEHAETLGRGRS